MKMTNILKLTFVDRDSWDRPVYRGNDNKYYVDVDPVAENANLCTKSSNAFDGEPDMPVNKPFVFLSERDRWQG